LEKVKLSTKLSTYRERRGTVTRDNNTINFDRQTNLALGSLKNFQELEARGV
jgi:hypothetical protein